MGWKQGSCLWELSKYGEVVGGVPWPPSEFLSACGSLGATRCPPHPDPHPCSPGLSPFISRSGILTETVENCLVGHMVVLETLGCLSSSALAGYPVLTEPLLGIPSRNAVGTAGLVCGSHDRCIVVLKLPGTGDAAWLVDCLLSMHETEVVISSASNFSTWGRLCMFVFEGLDEGPFPSGLWYLCLKMVQASDPYKAWPGCKSV